MKLLIVTQAVDEEHPILGFFCRWITEFAVHCEHVHVICLQAGKHSLPANVSVYSLGKEAGVSRLTYLWRFYTNIWQLRHEYDNVFVHMNQVYVILGAPFWRAWGKSIGLWYMHGSVSFSLRIAEKLTHTIFTGSPESFRLESKKVQVTGHGIDTTHFTPDLLVSKSLDLITVGRITEAKNLTALIDALAELPDTTITFTIVGAAVTQGEQDYEAKLRAHITAKQLTDRVVFKGKVPQTQLPTVLNQARVFVTTAQNGSLDKAVLEAMACGLPVVSMAPGTQSLPLSGCQVDSISLMTEQLGEVLKAEKPENYAEYILKNHSLTTLVRDKILKAY